MLADFQLPQPGSRVLLLNCHAYDTRLPWWKWHQPLGLLQLGQLLKSHECDVKFVDLLASETALRMTREKYSDYHLGEQEIDVWRFGLRWPTFTKLLNKTCQEGWAPDLVCISCSQTTWWQAARDLIERVRLRFPGTEIILGGTYPTLTPEHAELHSRADRIIQGTVAEAQELIPGFELYKVQPIPKVAGVYLSISQGIELANERFPVQPRDSLEIVQEIREKVALGVKEFAFFDDEIGVRQKQHFVQTLRMIAEAKLGVRFTAIGNISPRLIDADTAIWMKNAGYREINLRCDIALSNDGATFTSSIEDYQSCVAALTKAGGFRSRSGAITAMLLTGYPHENIEETAERAMILSSVVGAVSLLPFQYSPRTRYGELFSDLVQARLGSRSLEEYNCKLFPFAETNRNSFEDYIDLTRLAALLNSKYRSQTFNFLGDGLVAELLQISIRTKSWNPFDAGNNSSDEIIPLLPRDKGRN